MFKDRYNKEIENITLNEEKKEEILHLITERSVPKKIKAKRIIASVTAVAACFAIVISVWVGNSLNNNKVSVNERPAGTQSKETTPSYSEIYEKVKDFIPVLSDNVDGEGFGYLPGKVTANSATDVAKNSAQFETETYSTNKPNASKNDFSETTTQVEGVKEADIVKTDGKYIYSLYRAQRILRIISVGEKAKILSETLLTVDSAYSFEEIYLLGKKIVILGTDYVYKNKTIAFVYSVKDPKKPEKLFECTQSGIYEDSRLIGDKLYLISQYMLAVDKIDEDKPGTYIPQVKCPSFNNIVSEDSIFINNNCNYPRYTVICGFSMKDGSLVSSKSLLGGIYTLYCSTQNIIVAEYPQNNKTALTRFAIDEGRIKLKSTAKIEGSLLNQFSIDEYKGNFRFVVTSNGESKVTQNSSTVSYEIITTNALIILNKDFKEIGKIENLARNERVYSVRFMGDTAYFVTFRQVDPLFSVDLSDPKNPKIMDALKIPGFSNFLFPYGDGKLFGIGQDADENTGRAGNVKLSMFDISDPYDVKEIAKELTDSYYSEALYDHKAILVDENRNLIAFSVAGRDGTEFLIYEFNDGDFKKLAEIELENSLGDTRGVRGIYINKEFYIISDNNVSVYNISDFSKITELSFSK